MGADGGAKNRTIFPQPLAHASKKLATTLSPFQRFVGLRIDIRAQHQVLVRLLGLLAIARYLPEFIEGFTLPL